MSKALTTLFERGLAQLIAAAVIKHRKVYDFILLSDLKAPYIQAARILPESRPLTADLLGKAIVVLKVYNLPECVLRRPEDYAVALTWHPPKLDFVKLTRVQWVN